MLRTSDACQQAVTLSMWLFNERSSAAPRFITVPCVFSLKFIQDDSCFLHKLCKIHFFSFLLFSYSLFCVCFCFIFTVKFNIWIWILLCSLFEQVLYFFLFSFTVCRTVQNYSFYTRRQKKRTRLRNIWKFQVNCVYFVLHKIVLDCVCLDEW